MNRRQLLLSGAALIGCKGATPSDSDTDVPPPSPAPARAPSPDPVEPAGDVDLAAFPWGVLVGDPFGGACEVAVRTTETSVELVLYGHDGTDWSEAQRTTVAVDGPSARHTFSGLDDGAVYCLVALGSAGRSEVSRFRTAPAPGDLHEVHIGASSCYGRNNGELPNLTFTPAHDLDVFLQIGDYVYADGSQTPEAYLAVWDVYQRREGPRAQAAATGLIHTWDDHEVENNWTLTPDTADSITQDQLDVGSGVWSQVIPRSPGQGTFGLWRSLRWGDIVELFVLDCRGERGPGMVSEAQLAWFEEAMAASTAVFKLVLTSVHLTDHTELFSIAQEQDRWQGHPEQRARVVATCVNTPGTLVISGDMHFGAVQRVDPEGAPGQDLWEVAAGPSGSRIAPAAQIAEVAGFPAQYDLLLEAWTWCDLRLNPGDRTVTVDFVGDDGSILDSRELAL